MITKFLVILSGARPRLLDKCATERPRFQGLGLLVLINGILAMVSIWFLLAIELGAPPVLAFVGVVTSGPIVAGINRWLVSSMPIRKPTRWTLIAPRLILAMLLSSVIAGSIVLQIFHSQISAQVGRQQLSAFIATRQGDATNAEVSYWRSEVSNLEQIIASHGKATLNPSYDSVLQSLIKARGSAAALENAYYDDWQCQLYGGPDCAPRGNGPLARASENSYVQAKSQVDMLESEIRQRQTLLSGTSSTAVHDRYEQVTNILPAARQRLNSEASLETRQLASFAANANDGFLLDLQALDLISDKNFTTSLARFLLWVLFFIIGILPVLIKLVQRPGVYELLLREETERERKAAGVSVQDARAVTADVFSSHFHDGLGSGQNKIFSLRSDRVNAPRDANTEKPGPQDGTDEASRANMTRQDDPGPPAVAGRPRRVAPEAHSNDSLPDNAAPNALRGHAFISYVREDFRHVDRLQRRLEAAGVRVWRDTADLWPGQDWRVMIRRAITDDALVFIACFSRKSLAREKSYQNEELTLAIEQLRTRRPDVPWLIPVRLDECQIPDYDIGPGRTLASIQRADLFGKQADEGAIRLIEAVLRILGRDQMF